MEQDYHRTVMESSDFLHSMISLIDEPVKLTIWWTILMNPKITTKELKKKIKIKGNSVYYYLNQMEQLKLIDSQVEDLPNSNLTQKRFSISNDFLEAKSKGTLQEIFKDNQKEILLFEFLLMNSLLKHSIMDTKNLTEKEFTDNVEKNSVPFGELLLFTEEDIDKVKTFFKNIMEISSKTEIDYMNLPQGPVYGLVFACVDIKK